MMTTVQIQGVEYAKLLQDLGEIVKTAPSVDEGQIVAAHVPTLTFEQAAKVVGVSITTMRKLVKENIDIIQPITVGEAGIRFDTVQVFNLKKARR